MHHISKNWEGVFDFQYKVAIGQCDYLTNCALLYAFSLLQGKVKRQKVKVKDGGKWAYFLGWFQSRNLLVRLSLQRLRSKGQGHKKFMRYTFFEYKLCLYCRIFTFEEKVSFLWDLTPSLIVATENIYTPFKQVL